MSIIISEEQERVTDIKLRNKYYIIYPTLMISARKYLHNTG